MKDPHELRLENSLHAGLSLLPNLTSYAIECGSGHPIHPTIFAPLIELLSKHTRVSQLYCDFQVRSSHVPLLKQIAFVKFLRIREFSLVALENLRNVLSSLSKLKTLLLEVSGFPELWLDTGLQACLLTMTLLSQYVNGLDAFLSQDIIRRGSLRRLTTLQIGASHHLSPDLLLTFVQSAVNLTSLDVFYDNFVKDQEEVRLPFIVLA
jgi:hypothetical protein